MVFGVSAPAGRGAAVAAPAAARPPAAAAGAAGAAVWAQARGRSPAARAAPIRAMRGEVRFVSSIWRRFLLDRARVWMRHAAPIARHPEPYRVVRLAARPLWQPLFSSSRGGAESLPATVRLPNRVHIAAQHDALDDMKTFVTEIPFKFTATQHCSSVAPENRDTRRDRAEGRRRTENSHVLPRRQSARRTLAGPVPWV